MGYNVLARSGKSHLSYHCGAVFLLMPNSCKYKNKVNVRTRYFWRTLVYIKIKKSCCLSVTVSCQHEVALTFLIYILIFINIEWVCCCLITLLSICSYLCSHKVSLKDKQLFFSWLNLIIYLFTVGDHFYWWAGSVPIRGTFLFPSICSHFWFFASVSLHQTRLCISLWCVVL